MIELTYAIVLLRGSLRKPQGNP